MGDSMFAWNTISRLADTVVLVPLALVSAGLMVHVRLRRHALTWCLLFGAGLFVVAASKIAFAGWGIGIEALDFTGFSGHAMRATAVMPVFFYLLLRPARVQWRLAAVGLGLLTGILVGASRWVLHAHSVSEVVAGCLLGGVVAIVFLLTLWGRAIALRPAWLIGFTVLILLPTPITSPAPTEQWINTVALALSGHDRPFMRADWGRNTR